MGEQLAESLQKHDIYAGKCSFRSPRKRTDGEHETATEKA